MKMNKNDEKRKKTALIGARRAVLLVVGILLVALFCTVSASAWDFDNAKYFDKDAGGRGVATIKNAFGLGATLLETKLIDNSDICGRDCYAEGTTTLYVGGKVLDSLRFKEYSRGWKVTSLPEYNIYLVTYKEISVDDYGYVEVGRAVNGSDIVSYRKIGSHTEQQPIYTAYNGEVLTPGTYAWRIEGTKRPSQTIDWLGTFAGLEVGEWAIWGNISEGDEAEVILNSPTDNYTSPVPAVSFSCSANVTNGASLTNISLWNNLTGTWLLNQTTTYSTGGFYNLGINWNSQDSASDLNGIRIYPKVDVTLEQFDYRNYSTSCTTCYVVNNLTGTTVYSGAITSGKCILTSPITLSANTPYHLLIDRNTSSCGFGFSTNNTYPFDYAYFNITASYDGGAIRTDYWWAIANITLGGITYATTTYDGTVGDSGIWTCSAGDDDGVTGFATENRTIHLDTTAPTVNVTYPYGTLNYGGLGVSQTVNFTVADDNLASCWINYNYTNSSVTCGNFFTTITATSQKNATLYANDTNGNENSSFASWDYKVFENSRTYNTTALETSAQEFILNMSSDGSTSVIARLVYNETSYLSTKTGDNYNMQFNNTIYPLEGNNNFYWNITYGGSTYITTSTSQQNVTPLNALIVNTTCPAGFDIALFAFNQDEQNRTNQTMDIVNYNFRYGIDNGTALTTYGSLSTVSDFYLCINTSISTEYSLGYGEISYTKSGWADRSFYTFSNRTISNNSVTYIKLFSLANAEATSFLFDFKDTNLNPYVGDYVSLLRWYPSVNAYNVVEMAKTDDKGQAIMGVEVEDADYRVGLYYPSGTLIKLLNPVRFACLSSPCSYSSLVETTTTDYTSFFGVDTSLDYNETTGLWTYTWTDSSQNTKNMTLVVTRERGDGTYTICDTTAEGWTGVLTCDSSAYTGTIKAVAYRTASPDVVIASKIINTINTAFRSTTGLFFGLIIFLALVLIGIFSPVASIILGILALVPSVMLGTFNTAILMAIGVLGGIIIHFLKRSE